VRYCLRDTRGQYSALSEGFTSCACFNVVGMEDVSTVNPDVTLESFGLDSLMGVEIRQRLQHAYDISMSVDEIRALTFAKLNQLSCTAAASASPQSAADTATDQTSAAASVRYELHHLCPTEGVVEMNQIHRES